MKKEKLNLPKPYLSYSQVSTWKYNRGQYVDRYIFNVPIIETPELIFGQKFSKWLEKGKWKDAPKDVQKILERLIKHPLPEHELRCVLNTPKGEFEFLGFIDSYDPVSNRIMEYKTGRTVWDPKRVHEHLQTLLYAAIIYKRSGRIPKVTIAWIQTHVVDGVAVPKGTIKYFKQEITVQRMISALKELQQYALEIDEWFTDYKNGAKAALETADTPIPDWMK